MIKIVDHNYLFTFGQNLTQTSNVFAFEFETVALELIDVHISHIVIINTEKAVINCNIFCICAHALSSANGLLSGKKQLSGGHYMKFTKGPVVYFIPKSAATGVNSFHIHYLLMTFIWILNNHINEHCNYYKGTHRFADGTER